MDGIPNTSLPVSGPCPESAHGHCIPPVQQRYKLVAYADDVKPGISSMQEFMLVDQACCLIERASGVKLHRDPAARKVKFLALGRWKGTLTQEDLPFQYIKLSDHLDFVGVELRSTFIQTRKCNGDQLQARVQNTIGPWRSGKFMPLTLRPYSANTFVLSKVWFKCSSLNLRLQDISTINSSVKSWLYQDCLEKPSELVMFRQPKDGGLGPFNVAIRSMACLIRSFLETASNSNFRHSLFHEVLYRFHVLGETSLPDPGLTPYYDQHFFETIRHYHEHSPLNISLMTIKQWYSVLMEDKVLMSPPTDDSPRALLPIRAETLSPTTDWPNSWRLSRMPGLESDLSSFLFKLLHKLLPTQDRVSRIVRAEAELRGLCQLCHREFEDIYHAFFSCPHSRVSGLGLLGLVQGLYPDLQPDDVLQLHLGADLPPEDELAALYMVATGLKHIWEARQSKKQTTLFQVRAELEAKISLLRRTRYQEAGQKIQEMLEL